MQTARGCIYHRNAELRVCACGAPASASAAVTYIMLHQFKHAAASCTSFQRKTGRGDALFFPGSSGARLKWRSLRAGACRTGQPWLAHNWRRNKYSRTDDKNTRQAQAGCIQQTNTRQKQELPTEANTAGPPSCRAHSKTTMQTDAGRRNGSRTSTCEAAEIVTATERGGGPLVAVTPLPK